MNLATSQSELDILLQDFANSHIPPSSQDKLCIPLITKEIVEADLSKIPSNKATGLDERSSTSNIFKSRAYLLC